MVINRIAKLDRKKYLAEDSFRMIFYGPTGAGKTCYLFSLLNSEFVNRFRFVWCVSTNINFAQYKPYIWSDKFIAYDRVNEITNKADPTSKIVNIIAEIKDLMERIKAKAESSTDKEYVEKLKKIRALIIFDDCAASLNSKQVADFITYCRHYKISLIVLIQHHTNLTTTWKLNMSHILFFKQKEFQKRDFDAFGITITKAEYNKKIDATSDLTKHSVIIYSHQDLCFYYDDSDKDIIQKKYKMDFLLSTHSEIRNTLIKKYIADAAKK
ncbi:virion assembly protein [Carp edema virus]|nr:virion assembly protein [Carp edema virus]